MKRELKGFEQHADQGFVSVSRLIPMKRELKDAKIVRVKRASEFQD